MVQAEGGLLGLGLGVGSWEPVLGESNGGQGYRLVEVSSGVSVLDGWPRARLGQTLGQLDGCTLGGWVWLVWTGGRGTWVGGGNGLAGGVRQLGEYGKGADSNWLGQGVWKGMLGGSQANFGVGMEPGAEDICSLGGNTSWGAEGVVQLG